MSSYLEDVLEESSAKTFKDAHSFGLAALIQKKPEAVSVILYDPTIVLESLQGFSDSERRTVGFVDVEARLQENIYKSIKGAVVSNLYLESTGDDYVPYEGRTPIGKGNVHRISYSAAVEKYGPLVYELLINAVYPLWVTSDLSVKDKARRIWAENIARSDDFEHCSMLRLSKWKDAVEKVRRVKNDDAYDAIMAKKTSLNSSKKLASWMESLDTETKKQMGTLFLFRSKNPTSDSQRKLEEAHQSTLRVINDFFGNTDSTDLINGMFLVQGVRLFHTVYGT